MARASTVRIPKLRFKRGGRIARLASLFTAALVISIPQVLYADPIQTGTKATPIRQVGSIDCQGNPGSGNFGVMKVSRAGNSLDVDVELTGARANSSFTIELWESDPGCYPDNNGNTGVVITTDGSGSGSASVSLTLPHPSLGSSTLGDGAGTEQLVMALDDTFSAGGGDSYAAGPVSIDFSGENRPPQVNAGYDTSGNSANGAYVEGSVFDDGKLDPVITTWSKESGPGGVTFDDASSLATHVSFSKLGTYVLKLSAYDGEHTASDTVQVELRDSYRVELKSWIPQQQIVDPFVVVPTRFPNTAIPYMGDQLKECFQAESDGTSTGYVDILSSKFLGDNHTDYGQFNERRGNKDARIGTSIDFRWDGTSIVDVNTDQWAGITQRIVTIRAKDGSAKDCYHTGRAALPPTPEVTVSGNTFTMKVKGYDPLTPRNAGQVIAVVDELCRNERALCIPGLSTILRILPITPSLDGEVKGTIQPDGKLRFDYNADLFPSYAVGVRQNQGDVKTATFVDASCIPATGYAGAANLLVGLQTLTLLPFNGRHSGTVQEPYGNKACQQVPRIATLPIELLLRRTVNAQTEPFLLTAASRMPE
jgi:hypothetical protein